MLEKANAKSRLIVAIAFLVMILAGLIVTVDYGTNWDETMELQTLGSSLREYSHFLPWVENEPDSFPNGLAIRDETVHADVDHGQSAYYPVSPFLFMNMSASYNRSVMLIWHFYTFLLFMAGILCLYCIVKFLTGDWKYGLAASFLTYLSPRFFAEGHYNPKDIVTMVLIIICFWFSIKFIETKTFRYAAAFAATGAVAANTRVIGVAFFGLVGLLYIVYLTVQKQWSKKTLLCGMTAVLTFVGVYILLTPPIWTDPLQFISYTLDRSSNFSDWPGSVLFMGRVFRPVPSYYIPVMIAITTPILVVLLMIAGQITTIIQIVKTKTKDIFSGPVKYYLLAFLFVWVPLGFAIIKTPILYNSWRHFYFIGGPLMILATGALKFSMDKLPLSGKRIFAGIVAVQLCFSATLIVMNHPYEYTYYNILAGTNPVARYELDYWNVSAADCIKKLIDEVNSPEIIEVYPANYGAGDGLKKAYDILPQKYRNRIQIHEFDWNHPAIPSNAKYVLVNPMSPIDLNSASGSYRQIVSIEAFGSDIMEVYERTN